MPFSASPNRLELIALEGVPIVAPGDDLSVIVLDALARSGLVLAEYDVLVVAQKIVSKSEGRLVRLETVEPSPRAREIALVVEKDPRLIEIILGEAREVLRMRAGIIVVEDVRGLVLANAGVDASNVNSDGGDESVLLLPADPDASAARLRADLSENAGRDVAVVINDSIGRAWRNGTIGTAIGVSGLPGLLDLRGTPDLFGRTLRTTDLGLADEIAAAASLLMGQAGEGRPLVLVRGVPYARRDGTGRELLRPKALDFFR
ncbi:MAG TPA: coenzyme F420-0:L-glutamate ligase [Rhizomicrobium sp.]|jgi:coenzyme F420-0:L-glutamate ligase/coenzyme F420-1:gamma-L-glutamate ligase|nr:coenzyme F420-0:L-glutamate ligase [Rhizomicrobium sp.]